MKRKEELFLQDILWAIEDIESFTRDEDFKQFCEDEKAKSAVVWKIHIIGEATKNLSKSIRDRYKEVPWRYMARMRDKIAHFYFGIDYEIVWDVAKKRLPKIKPLLKKMLEDIKE